MNPSEEMETDSLLNGLVSFPVLCYKFLIDLFEKYLLSRCIKCFVRTALEHESVFTKPVGNQIQDYCEQRNFQKHQL